MEDLLSKALYALAGLVVGQAAVIVNLLKQRRLNGQTKPLVIHIDDVEDLRKYLHDIRDLIGLRLTPVALDQKDMLARLIRIEVEVMHITKKGRLLEE
jgi:tRNA A37 threonylcarbamoyladenosine synthetase subunit TsaC/SUA5/YrdC